MSRTRSTFSIDNTILEGGTGAWVLDRPAVEELERTLKEVAESIGQGVHLIPLPSTGDLAHMLTAVYWASVLPDEHRLLRPSLVYAAEYATDDHLALVAPATLTAEGLARLAPAQPPGSHFWIRKGMLEELQLFAITQRPPAGVIVRAEGPGQVLVEFLHANIAALRRREFLDLTIRQKDGRRRGTGVGDVEFLVAYALSVGEGEPALRLRLLAQAVVKVLAAMRKGGHGGTILVVPSDEPEQTWRRTLDPSWVEISSRKGLDTALDELAREPDEWKRGQQFASDGIFQRILRSVASLSAVDGATVIDDRGVILGFGAKVRLPQTVAEGAFPVVQTLWAEMSGKPARKIGWSDLGGTRHLAAILFVAQNPKCAAMVVSMDGPVKLISWSRDAENHVTVWTDLELMLVPAMSI